MKLHTFILTAAVVVLSATVYAGSGPIAKSEAKPAKPAATPAKPNVKPYTLDTCIVSGDKLGEMGKPVVFNYKYQEIKLCCKACRKDFDKDPAKFLKKLEPKK